MKKSLGLISAALVGMAALGACGSQDYCDVYQDSNEEFSDLDFAEMDGLDKPRDYAEQLRDTAPNDEIEDAWQDVEATFDGLRDALDDADMSFDDFKQLQDQTDGLEPPEGVSKKQLAQLSTNVSEIVSEHNTQEAWQTIENYGDENCAADQ